jgi:hypothetical protein
MLGNIADSIKAGGCGANPALEAMQAAEDQLNAAIADATADINGAIADIQSQVDEAQAALEGMVGDALSEVRTLQGDVAKLMKDALNPLGGGLEEKLQEFRDHYAGAVEDIDQLIGSVTSMIDNPLGALDSATGGLIGDAQALLDDPLGALGVSIPSLCDLPNVKDSPDGTPIAMADEAPVPAVDAVQEPCTRPTPSFTSQGETIAREAGNISRLSGSIVPAEDAIGPLEPGVVNAMQAAMLQRESSGNYRAVNSIGYAGGYQFGAAALEDLGYLKPGASAGGNRAMQNPANWTGRNGVSSLDGWLSNRPSQDTAFRELASRNYTTLRRIGRINDSTPREEVAGLLAASHLLGAGGAAANLASVDANGVSGNEYAQIGRAAVSYADSSPTQYPDARPATTGSGSVTLATLTSGNSIPYVPATHAPQGSAIYGLTVDQINNNLELLASDVMSPIKDRFPDLVVTHGFRSEHVELSGGTYGPRRNPGGSQHYAGMAADFQFTGVTSKAEMIERGNAIRQLVPGFDQFILEYPGSFDNGNFLYHISYRPGNQRMSVLTAMSNNGQRAYRDGFV